MSSISFQNNKNKNPINIVLSPAVITRLQRDFTNLKRSPISEYFAIYELHQDKLNEWIVFILAPPATVYSGGIFKMLIRFPEAFPMEPPSLTFLGPMWHPNIYRDGKVCLSVIQIPPPNCPPERLSEYWRPVNGVEQVMLSCIALLSSPEPNDPANATAASQYVNDRKGFELKVKEIIQQNNSLIPSDFIKPVVVHVQSITTTTTTTTTNKIQEPTPKRMSQAIMDEDEEYQYDDADEYPILQDSQQQQQHESQHDLEIE
jgi:ubiquitin-protein ligase